MKILAKRSVQMTMVLTTIISISLLYLGCAGQIEVKETPRNIPPNLHVTITAMDGSFNYNQIRVRPGQRVHVVLINNGKHEHSIFFELPGGNVALVNNVPVGKSGSLDFIAPRQTGAYIYYCPVEGHRLMGMEGKLIVSNGGNTGASRVGNMAH